MSQSLAGSDRGKALLCGLTALRNDVVHRPGIFKSKHTRHLESMDQWAVATSATTFSLMTWITAEAKANRIIEEELLRLQWTRNDLTSRAKSDPAKLTLAARLRQETTLSVKTLPDV